MAAADEMRAACAALSDLLRKGRLADVPDAARRVEDAMASAASWPADQTAAIRHEAASLRRQLEAVARGIRSAQARLSDIRSALSAPSTYDGAGRRTGLSPAISVARRF